MIRTLALAAVTFSIATAAGAVTVYNAPGTFTPSQTVGFEGLGTTANFTGIYAENGVTVQYIGSAQIWSYSQAAEGQYSWYENGGGSGYTSFKFAAANVFELQVGSGWGSSGPALAYELLSGGTVVATGNGIAVPSYTGFRTVGFSGVTFDEVHLQVRPSDFGAFDPAGFEAGAYDAVKIGSIAVPEAATWAMMITGFGMVGMGMRRRRVVAA
jgi:hypothetical protein